MEYSLSSITPRSTPSLKWLIKWKSFVILKKWRIFLFKSKPNLGLDMIHSFSSNWFYIDNVLAAVSYGLFQLVFQIR